MKRSDKKFPAMLLIAAICLSQSTGVFAGELSGSEKNIRRLRGDCIPQ